MNQTPPDVHDRQPAIAFVKWCVEHLGLGYHSDTPFDDYVEKDGKPVFTSEQTRTLDALTEKACAFIDPAEIGSREFEELLGRRSEKE